MEAHGHHQGSGSVLHIRPTKYERPTAQSVAISLSALAADVDEYGADLDPYDDDAATIPAQAVSLRAYYEKLAWQVEG